jgi:hypothetical protein
VHFFLFDLHGQVVQVFVFLWLIEHVPPVHLFVEHFSCAQRVMLHREHEVQRACIVRPVNISDVKSAGIISFFIGNLHKRLINNAIFKTTREIFFASAY